MARNKELMVLVLDVGPHMHVCLPEVGQTLFNVVLSKILNKPSHEVAVVLFGTTETKNVLHQEFAEQGDKTQFLNVYTAHVLQCTDLLYLRTFENLPKGYGKSDFVDALFVALDVLLKATDERMLEKCPKRIIMISNFMGVPQALDEDSRAAVVARLQENGVVMDFYDMEHPPDAPASKRENLNVISSLLVETAGSLKSVAEGQLATLFTAKDIAPFTMYRGPLSIGPNLNIKVRVCKKASRETLPSLKPYSDRSEDPNATHVVIRDTEYRAPSNPDEVVPPEERIKAYRYGKQNVPLAKEDEKFLEYQPDKGFHVVGFVDVSQVPRQQYTKEPSVVLPDLDDPGSCVAISALAQALEKQNKVCIARPVLRARDSAKLVALTPLMHSPTPFRPDCLVMNHLPFIEDVRSFYFEPFKDRPDAALSKPQLAATANLVKSMNLITDSGSELVKPESTINPALNRFYSVLGLKALNPEAPVPEPDSLVDLLLEPPLKKMKEAVSALEQTKELFELEAVGEKTGAGKGGRGQGDAGEEGPVARFAEHAQAAFVAGEEDVMEPLVEHVSSSTPAEDFRAMLQAGHIDAAIQEMGAVVAAMVGSSVGERAYDKALRCVHEMRRGCIEVERPGEFNDTLQQWCDRFKTDPTHSGFWARVMAANVTLINCTECVSSTLSSEDSKEFIRRHAMLAAPVVEQAAVEVEDDEFADLE